MKKIVLKTALVDEEIIPLLKWINNLPGTLTEFSCAGHRKRKYACFCGVKVPAEEKTIDGYTQPYVLLRCWNHSSMFYIMNFIAPFCEYSLSDYGTRSVYGEVDSGQPRFSFYFKSKKSLIECISKLPRIKMEMYDGTT